MSPPDTTSDSKLLLPATRWLYEAPTDGLAAKLVATGTHDPATAEDVAQRLDAIEQQVQLLGPVDAAQKLYEHGTDAARLRRDHYVLATAAAADQVPLWDPPRHDGRAGRRVLEPIEQGLLRLAAINRPDRIIPVALAEKGATTTQMAAVDHADLEPAGRIWRADLQATERSTVARTVELAPWAYDGTAEHLTEAADKGRAPCYGGSLTAAAAIAKAIDMRIRRVLDEVGIPATVASLRLTTCVTTLQQAGPVEAMKAGGFNSIVNLHRYIGEHRIPTSRRATGRS